MTQVQVARHVVFEGTHELSVERTSNGVYEVVFLDGRKITIPFQTGEDAPNGVTLEALIMTCVDRLETFQAGEFACSENAEAIGYLEQALRVLSERSVRVAAEDA